MSEVHHLQPFKLSDLLLLISFITLKASSWLFILMIYNLKFKLYTEDLQHFLSSLICHVTCKCIQRSATWKHVQKTSSLYKSVRKLWVNQKRIDHSTSINPSILMLFAHQNYCVLELIVMASHLYYSNWGMLVVDAFINKHRKHDSICTELPLQNTHLWCFTYSLRHENTNANMLTNSQLSTPAHYGNNYWGNQLAKL